MLTTTMETDSSPPESSIKKESDEEGPPREKGKHHHIKDKPSGKEWISSGAWLVQIKADNSSLQI